ncbi:mucin-6 [Pelobates fuscus]|uniref:mucin-6 n=1 Tax=Pelobates fuscus TaxID=191477 RepID=UPI002FE4BA8D
MKEVKEDHHSMKEYSIHRDGSFAGNNVLKPNSGSNTQLVFQQYQVALSNDTDDPVASEYDSFDYATKGVCSTWGNNHFFTFDNDLYEFSGTCNYILATVCNTNSPEFNIQVQREGGTAITRIMIQVGSINVVVQGKTITLLGKKINLPFATNGIEISKIGAVTRLSAKQKDFVLTVSWSTDGNLMVELDRKFMNRTCGLCGNFNRVHKDEFVVDGKLMMPYQFASMNQMDDPDVICPMQVPKSSTAYSSRYINQCYSLLDLVGNSCLVPKTPFIKRCQLDLQHCATPGDKNCACATLSQYSARCSLEYQPVNDWRSKNLCPLEQCEGNQLYKECGAPCSATCSNPSYTCNSHCVYGCFCPPGTVLDDLSKNKTCVQINECPCVVNGEIYNPGDHITTDCSICQCHMGQWSCKETPCPGRCAIEGGSFITTFDANMYRFHGVCVYVLVTSGNFPSNVTVMASFEKCGLSNSETCLASIIFTSAAGAIIISKQDQIIVDGQLKQLPYVSSLCGNFNSKTEDDFLSSSGIVEGTVTVFVDSWKATSNCKPATNIDFNPCSMSISNQIYAETHCSLLVKKGSLFEQCRTLVDPEPYYKRCVYEACNYQETINYICSAMGSYARACASQGLVLKNWRHSTNCTIACSGNQTYSYDTSSCSRTCLSLSNVQLECYPNDIPIEGCNCPLGYYLDDKENCVPKSRCPCYLDETTVIMPNQQTLFNGLTCYCISGKLNCIGKPAVFEEICESPKVMKTCGSLTEKYGAACAPSCQILATGIQCIPTKCESGCVCPAGTYEDLDGSCVVESDCSCEYGGNIYKTGEMMESECQSCTCNGGQWQCEKNPLCASTCVLYGESHIKTFDGHQFMFEGNCEYTLVTDGCGVNSSLSSFKIVTENVICGTTGVTCSRTIIAYIGETELKMYNENYKITPDSSAQEIKVHENSLYIMFDITIPNKFFISLLWNKDMNVFIKILKLGKESVCGLCGNYNGNMKDDYETRSRYVASNQLEFINSWKDRPTCTDATFVTDPCDVNPHRKSWAEKTCSYINSKTFDTCHSVVPTKSFHDSCMSDVCSCDTGGDCECACNAIAAYAKACLSAGVCVDWRTPHICPVYCDYLNSHIVTEDDPLYNINVNCTWHYQPCQCPSAPHGYPYQNSEGCYQCGPDKYHDPEKKTCVPCTVQSTTPQTPTATPTTVTETVPSAAVQSTTPQTSTATPTTVTETVPSTASSVPVTKYCRVKIVEDAPSKSEQSDTENINKFRTIKSIRENNNTNTKHNSNTSDIHEHNYPHSCKYHNTNTSLNH